MAWPNTMTADQRLDDAAARLNVIAERVRVAIHLYENNLKFVFDNEFNNRVPASEARVMFQFLQHTLIRSLILEILKVWDSPGNNRDSIPTICVLINQPKIIDRQRERQLANLKSNSHFEGDLSLIDWVIENRDRDAEQIATERHAKLGQVLADIEAYIPDNALLDRLREFRDRHIAHSLSTKLQRQDSPFYGDAGDLLRATEPFVNGLLECVCYGSQPWQEFHKIAAAQADELWSNATFAIATAD